MMKYSKKNYYKDRKVYDYFNGLRTEMHTYTYEHTHAGPISMKFGCV